MDDLGGYDEPGGYDDLTGGTDPGLPGDDIIFLAMLDDEERSRRADRSGGAVYGPGGGCCGCALPLAMGALALAGALAVIAW